MLGTLTVPLLCLLAFVAWTIALVAALTIARLRHLANGGSVRDFGVPDDRRLVWRLFRAHANCVEKATRRCLRTTHGRSHCVLETH
jgi:hypothetical protein